MKFKDFEFREYKREKDVLTFELVKWNGTNCFVISFFEYDIKEETWRMAPVGLRWLQYDEPGLSEYVKTNLKLVDICYGELTHEEI